MGFALNAVACLVLAWLRAAGHKSKAYQAAAHFYVGGLFTAAWCLRRPYYLSLALALTCVECLAFALTRAKGAWKDAAVFTGAVLLGLAAWFGMVSLR